MRRLLAVALAAVIATSVAVPSGALAGAVTTWPVGDRPFGAVVDPDGRVYVTNEGSNTVSVVDPATGAVRTVFVGRQPGLLALDPIARRLYVSNSGDLTLSVIDTNTLAVVATVFNAGGLGVAVDPVARRAYVAGGSQFVVINTATNGRISTIGVSGFESWFGVAHDPELHRLYITNIASASPSLRVLDDRDLGFVGNVALPKTVRFALAVDPSTHAVYLASEDPLGWPFANSEFYVVDPNTLTIVHTTPLGGLSAGMALAPTRHRIYVTDNTGRRLHELDAHTFARLGTSDLPWDPFMAVVHPDGRVYVAGYSGDELGAVQVGNNAPVIESLSLSTTAPRTNDVLEVAVVASDPDGDALSYSYQWSRNGSEILGATAATLDLSVVGAGDRGDEIAVAVTVSDGLGSATATASVTVVNSAPTVTLALSPSDPTSDAVLTAAATGFDVDGDSLTYAFDFRVNDVVKSVSSPNSSATLDLALPGNGDGGDTIAVDVVASDGTLESTKASASVVVANSAPSATVGLSDETPWKTDVLVATATGHDGDGDPLVFTYRWFVDGSVVRETTTSATTDSLDLKPLVHNGDVITVSVTASDGVTTSPSATASAVVTPPGHRLQ